jgi:cytochrome b6-f complex iron-sulfur subunit
MSNYEVEPAARPQAITSAALRVLRRDQVQGISRRRLLRTSLFAGLGLWIAELGAGSIGFLWPNMVGGFGGKVRIGTFDDVRDRNLGLPIDKGFPAYVPEAKTFVVLVDPTRQEFTPGADPKGEGVSINVRPLYQRCPHLGCRPNPCLKTFWFECPCHQSRYDRLGIKAKGVQFGPAARSMDRFAAVVDAGGVLTVDTGTITLGPLPVALGQPGIIPPLALTGCI